MGEVDRARLKVALHQHYAAQREVATEGTIDALAAAMAAEDARCSRASRPEVGPLVFAAAQVRYIPAWTWVAHVALVALMCLVAMGGGGSGAAKVAVGVLSAASVLVGVPTLHASKLHGVAELEYACPRNAASVLVARLAVLGCASALAVACMVAATAASLDAGAFSVALWACPPFFCSCAGALMALRKAAPSVALTLAMVWTTACCGALLALAATVPDLYAGASLATWAAAAGLALAWLVHEVTATLRAAAAGLDAFSPQLARTHH